MKYSLKELKALPTILQGQADDLKIEIKKPLENGEVNHTRVWLSRLTKEDGMPYDNQVTVEVLGPSNSAWSTVRVYEAK